MNQLLLALAVILCLFTTSCSSRGSSGDDDDDGDNDSDTEFTYDESFVVDQVAEFPGMCLDEPLAWNEATHTVEECDVYVEIVDVDECPEWTPDDLEGIAVDGNIVCMLPEIESPLDCETCEAAYSDGIGWYYCEDMRENHPDNCDPAGPWTGIDDDGDGDVDCEDADCWACEVCLGEPGVEPDQAEDECHDSCRYGIRITENAVEYTDGLTAFFVRSFRCDPKARYDNAEEMLRAWRHVFESALELPAELEDFAVLARRANAATPVAEGWPHFFFVP